MCDHHHQSASDHSNAMTTFQFLLLGKGSKEALPDHKAKLCTEGTRGDMSANWRAL